MDACNTNEKNLIMYSGENDMELKLHEEEKQESTGRLRLSGVEKPEHSDDEANDRNPWDFDGQEPYQMTSISNMAVNSADYSSAIQSKNTGNNIVLAIGKTALYVLFILDIIVIVWCCQQSKVDLYTNLLKWQWVGSICSIVGLIDAILVNVLYERKISLIVIAFFLSFLYPWRRAKFTNGNGGIGALIAVGMVVASVTLFASTYSAFTSYGNVVMEPDAEIRKSVAEVIDQPTEDGSTLGTKIGQNVTIQSADVRVQGNTTQVIIAGMGRHYVDTSNNALVEMNTKTIPTQLLFVKNGEQGTYQLSGAALDDKALSSQYLEFYNNSVLFR